MSDFLFRSISLWVVLLCGLFSLAFTVIFGWSVKHTLDGGHRLGVLGTAAVEIASFPSLANKVIADGVTGMDEHIRVPRTDADLSQFEAVTAKPGINLEGLFLKCDRSAAAQASGWRILIGAFTLDGEAQHAALALGPDLTVEHVWYLNEDAVKNRTPLSPHRKLIHGFDLLQDGSAIFTFDHGVSIQCFDSSSSPVWAVAGSFSHAVTIHDDGQHVWSVTENALVELETATGSICRHLSMDEIIKANPTIDLLEIRKYDDNDMVRNRRNTFERWTSDPFHLNDVDPLPQHLADNFPAFDTGDLLVSVRSLNLVFVLDPDTLEAKWWRSGAFRRQHDPDWGNDGRFWIYDNRMGRDYSRIVSIDPATYQLETVYDGSKTDFYSRIRGKQQFTDAGNLLITSSQQGRVMEVDANGNHVLEFLNLKPGDERWNYVISEAMWLPWEELQIDKRAS